MLKKFRILIYENWLSFIYSLIITFLIFKNIFIVFPLSFLFLWQIRGSFSQAIFYSFIFLPIVFIFKNNLPSFFVFLVFLFILTFLFMKKKFFSDWLIFFFSLFSLFFLNQLNKIDLVPTILISVLISFIFAIFFLQKELLITFIYPIIFLEIIFLFQFLPFGFYLRTVIILIILFLILKFDIIKI